MERSSHSRFAMHVLSTSTTPEKPKTGAHLCLSPTDPSENPALNMTSPVLGGNSAGATLPGLQLAISSHRPLGRLSSFSSTSYEQENTASVVSSADEDEPKTVPRRKKGTRRGTLHPEAKNVLKAWMFSPEHFAHPYPSEEEKEELANEAGIEVKQLSNWFTNARKRLWQPVLRQSGVEVKNFLSTGRGGPRGNKLDVPLNLHQLVSSPVPSPPSSPRKRSWSVLRESSASSPLSLEDKRQSNSTTRKRSKPASICENPQDLELLAATSLLGLQHMTQSVH